MPEAVTSFLLKKSITKHESTITWGDIESENRKFADKTAYRYFFISKPKEILIENAPEQDVELDLHPENKKGGRKFKTKDKFYITEDDFKSLTNNKLNRLMDCLNFVKKGNKLVFDSVEYAKFKDKGEKIIHWLPKEEKLIKVEVLMPDNTLVEGLGEQSMQSIKEDQLVQLERFGFARCDKKEKAKIIFWYTHK